MKKILILMGIICLLSLPGIASNSLVNSNQKIETQTETPVKIIPFWICIEVGFEVCGLPQCFMVCGETWQQISTKINEWRAVFEEVNC